MDPHATETPEDRFSRLSAFPYAAHTLAAAEGEEPTGLVYLAEGSHEGYPVLLLHGGPTWSYLWRRVIPSLTEAGCRVLAPDLIGFGRSAKPRDPREVTVEGQVALLVRLLEEDEVEEGTLVFHGMSAALGLSLLAAARGRLSEAVGVCPVVSRAGAEVEALVGRLREVEELSASALVAEGCAAPPPEVVRRAYDAPLAGGEPDAGLRALPS
ncbi:MAG TPA: alpha/beta fold hydrolase, partial [Kofleriaceae bacterium]|nr:alpha/beta fold hydrolase [Kofleriaceae bacterium]